MDITKNDHNCFVMKYDNNEGLLKKDEADMVAWMGKSWVKNADV